MMFPFTIRLLVIAVGLPALLHCSAAAPNEIPPQQIEFFEKKIRPLLSEHCYECHSTASKKVKGGLLLDSREGLLKGGDSGPALVPGEPEKSLLVQAVRYQDDDLQMPPKHKLDPEQIADLEAWVKMGGPDPRKPAAGATPLPAGIDLEAARTFWSFQPVRDPIVPSVKNSRWPKTDVDRFVLARLEEKNIAPNPDADKRTLLRRATFNLTGLPPTPQAMDDFLADKSPHAFEKVIDRLLESQAYGEQWGRHWLDLVRYADTSGCNSDYPIPSAYKYRNYVIESFGRDKPFDQFLREQIAGDLLPASSESERHEKIIATGYLAIGRRFGSRASEFHLTLEDIIDNIGKTMLGLSVSCARCHDHKYDPVSMTDYYALYGILDSTRFAFPGTEIYKHPKDFIPLTGAAEAEEYFKDAAELAALDDLIEKLQEEKKALERAEKQVAKTDEDTDGAAQVERKDHVKLPEKRTLIEVKAALEDARTRQRILENKTYKFEKAYAVAEGKPANARIQKKGDPKTPGEEVPRGFLQVLGGQKLPPEASGSGRLELAHWLTNAKNPLTARVIVNRIWQYHFGKGLVPTPNDFGRRGKPPTHPELLDWLASRFMESGWSIKQMHQRLMLSRVYQLSSEHRPEAASADPDNEQLWKHPRRRLSAEEIRDAIMAISGALDHSIGGPHPFPPENEWRYTQHKPFVAVYDSNHRSVYLMQQRIKRHPYLEIFDGPDPNATTPERPISTTPIQALFMMNAPFTHGQADRLAVRVGLAFREDRERIDYAYRLALGRPARADELRSGEEYLKECRDAMKATRLPFDQQPRAALASYMRVLLSSNEFLYLD